MCDFLVQIQPFLIAAFTCKASTHSSYVILFYILCYIVTLCYVFYIMLCYVSLCHEMLCYILKAGLLYFFINSSL